MQHVKPQVSQHFERTSLAWSTTSTAVASTMPGYSKLSDVPCPPYDVVVTNFTLCLELLHGVLSSTLPVHPEVLHVFLDHLIEGILRDGYSHR